jgi:sugar phosphate isomerase/epimerase
MPPGKIADTSTKLTPAVIQKVSELGYRGIVRYVPLPNNPPSKDIDREELEAILGGGLGVLLVQHVRRPPWNPAEKSGSTDALNALEFARAAGYLPNAHIFLDLEGIAGTSQGTKQFAEEWAKTIVDAGYSAGCYVGFDVPLSAEQLFQLRHINSYWSDAGPRKVATRGFAIKQHAEINIVGTRFDPDTVQQDELGETPLWLVPASAIQMA